MNKLTNALAVPWRLWSAACDVADARVITPYGRFFPAIAFFGLVVACIVAASQ